ncbi:AAA family ATPase [Nocardioides sp. NPDC059952]|uniref:ATP-binding protein n=1 Tax=Nocardioides sp. NPDC059952 TaxID=3347014 RepID=UPI0036557E5F
MILLHLTAVGSGVPAATLEFAPRLTVVYGASEAGKSYIVEALDFMLGGSSRLRSIPEADGYSAMLLGIDFGTKDVVTLARSMRGGRIAVFEEDVREIPDRSPDFNLSPKHVRDSAESISHYLLDRMGIANAKVRKNKRNEVVSMSFRNLAHLVLVDEERIQSRTSPVETGNYSTRTSERSVLKLLLEGEDDSGLSGGEDPTAFRQVNRGQMEVLERAIAQAREQLDGAPSREECSGQMIRLDASIGVASTYVSTDLMVRDRIVDRRVELQDERRRLVAKAAEADVLYQRFSLLDSQYEADLGRLEMVKNAGTLLGYFDVESCVFCGAAAEHQQREHAVYETVLLGESVDAESRRTRALRRDLEATMAAVRDTRDDATTRADELGEEIASVTAELAEVDDQLSPIREDLSALIQRRSQVERWLSLWHRVDDLDQLMVTVARQKAATSDEVAGSVGMGTERYFSETLRRILEAWHVPGAETAEFRMADPPDVVVEQRWRADRGKGMRSVLHAGFSVALSEYCLERDLPHPGFVALDTPVLTYRDADTAILRRGGRVEPGNVARGDDELMSRTVAQSFYDYLATGHPGQTLVLENQTPPRVEAEGCKVVFFTGVAEHGRAGFYPVRMI